jgi:hypothetical protein
MRQGHGCTFCPIRCPPVVQIGPSRDRNHGASRHGVLGGCLGSCRGLIPGFLKGVLLIDQLEELFTQPGVTAEQRTRFGEIVAALARSGVVWVIATIRSDLAYRLDEVKDLGAHAAQGAHIALKPPDAAQLLEIVRVD